MTEIASEESTGQPERIGFTVKGTDVLITRSGDSETLQIDGRVVDFYRTEKGYSLKRDVFRKPAQTLREAVERYLESEQTE